jgi:hypothetical protein
MTFALADLNDLLIGHEGRWYSWPVRHQRLAAPGCQRKIHSRHRTEHT